MDSEAYMYGLAVLPEFHGKGYGGKALRNMVKKEQDAGYNILLEVETKNDNTLRLYESIGFVSVQGQDYYLWNGYKYTLTKASPLIQGGPNTNIISASKALASSL